MKEKMSKKEKDITHKINVIRIKLKKLEDELEELVIEKVILIEEREGVKK